MSALKIKCMENRQRLKVKNISKIYFALRKFRFIIQEIEY